MKNSKRLTASRKRTILSAIRLRPFFERLEERAVLITGEWTPLGPFTATNGQVENIADKPVVGAIVSVLAHPTDPNTVYVGSVNGGVWKSVDSLSPQPHWTPLTDKMPSQSISALAFDLADTTSRTIYAGVGLYSSYAQLGNNRIGLMRSTDAGQNWQVVDGGGVLKGANISGVFANGNTIVVSVNVSDTFDVTTIGIFRSTDGGVSFTQISTGTGATTGLPNGVSYDLVADPLNPSVLYAPIVFSVGGTNGLYKSVDAGATWTKVSSAAMDALIVNNTSNFELAAGRNNEVYASIINVGALAGLFRSPDNGATWVAMDLPRTNETGGDVGLNPRGGKGPSSGPPQAIAGGQGAIHFSIVADPNNANIVYVGGDRQPRGFRDQGSFPNAIGANDFSGRLFRGDASRPLGSQFVHLTHRNNLGAVGGGTASSSSPHADSRDMTFDANGNILEVDDGGVYRRTSPQDNTGDWFSVIGNLQLTEAHDVAWDSLSNVAMSGNQDTGSTFQPVKDATQWVSISTGDGGDIGIDNIEAASSNQSIRYSSFQNLGGLRRTVWDATGGLVSTSFPRLTPDAASPAFVPGFRTPLETNTVAGGRLLIQGTNALYESLDAGATISAIGVGQGVSFDGIFSNAIWYGGTKNNVANPDLVWAASGSDVFMRTAPNVSVTRTAGDPTSQLIRDLAVNSADHDNAYVVDGSRVFESTNAGTSWNDITGNLLSLVNDIYSVSFVAGPIANSILVGTNLGVLISSTATPGIWDRFGDAFPNVIAFDMEYNTTDDTLVVGTMGRGVWSLTEVKKVIQSRDKSIEISFGAPAIFVENSPAVLAASTAKFTQTNVPSFAGGVLSIGIENNFQSGDFLDLSSQGIGAGEIAVFGTQVSYEGRLIGTYSGRGQTINITLTAEANDVAIERLLSRLTFVHVTDNPSPNPRTVAAFLDNGTNGLSKKATFLVDVVPVNDAPRSSNVALASVDEDTTNPVGSPIGTLLRTSFQDPDGTLAGIAVTANAASAASGQWQYSLGSNIWLPIGSVSTSASLVLSASTRVRFLPAKDFFGRPTSLGIRVLDNTYAGAITTSSRVEIDTSAPTPSGAFAFLESSLGVQIVPINDAPTTTVPKQLRSVNQDASFVFTVPSTWFADVDNPTLTLSASLEDGSRLPAWLSFDPVTARFSGVPRNSDVGVYEIGIRATDTGDLFTTLPFQLEVLNVNDAPTNIGLTRNSVLENELGAFIGSLSASDVDPGDSFVFQIADPRFFVLDNQLFVSPGVRFDYETNPFIQLQITVTDSGNPPLSFQMQHVIEVLDVNEFAPSLKITSVNVSEATPSGTEIVRLAAPDLDTSNVVRFRFFGTPSSSFDLDQDTGRISIKPNVVLDHESVSAFQFLVEAYDNGLPILSTTASVSVNVTDVNEFSPEITSSVISVSERQLVGVPFSKLRATDNDTSETVRFFLPNSETRFTVNPVTGDLSLTRSDVFDFERSASDSIVVIAEDSGSPSRRVEKTLAIQVLDANDPPTAAIAANPDVLSNVSDLSLGKLTILDQDVGQTYSVVSSDDRFVVVDGNLVLAPGKGVGESDPLQMVVPIVVTEIGAEGKSYPLNVSLNRISNKFPWQNRLNPLDTNRIDGVNPLDVLALINGINGGQLGKLPFPRPASSLTQPDFDVDGDGTLNPLDVLMIINSINNRSNGEGEGEASIPKSTSIPSDMAASDGGSIWLAAYSQLEEELNTLRRRRN